MDTHQAGRATQAWRERNEGAETPGDGQTVPNYVEPAYPAGGPEPGTVGLPVTDDHAEPEPKPEPETTRGGLSTENSPGLLGPRR